MTDRQTLRRDMRDARTTFVQSLSPAVRRALEAALARQLAPHIAGARILGSYAALNSEIDPQSAEQHCTAALAFPRAQPDTALTFHATPSAGLVPGYRGIMEPAADATPLRPDMLLVPLLAADRHGNRLGQGGGHYDRTLTALRASGPLIAIGIGWDIQLRSEIPAEPWDAPLDALATPTAFHWCRPAAMAQG